MKAVDPTQIDLIPIRNILESGPGMDLVGLIQFRLEEAANALIEESNPQELTRLQAEARAWREVRGVFHEILEAGNDRALEDGIEKDLVEENAAERQAALEHWGMTQEVTSG